MGVEGNRFDRHEACKEGRKEYLWLPDEVRGLGTGRHMRVDVYWVRGG